MDSEHIHVIQILNGVFQLCSVWFSMCVFAHTRVYVCVLSADSFDTAMKAIWF